MGSGALSNKPCGCGSGKKFKRCCKDKGKPSAEDIAMIQNEIRKEMDERRPLLESIGIFINFVKPKVFNGKKYWGIGSRLYYRDSIIETFHEFILNVLKETLGMKWGLHQETLDPSQQHYIFKCFKNYASWIKANSSAENKEGYLWAALPDGRTRSLISLAFDIVSLSHASTLPESLLNRLRNYNEYQGVRYEISIASIFARLGYEIEFLNDNEIEGRRCEFYARDPKTGEVIAVEAKSTARDGILHKDGKYDGEIWANIRRHYRKAMKQNPGDKPFLIFIDINAPQTPGVNPLEKPWIKEVREMHDKIPINSPENLALCSGIVFTNYSFHYQEENQATAGECLVDIPLHCVFPIKNPLFWERLLVASNNYGNVPNLDEKYGI